MGVISIHSYKLTHIPIPNVTLLSLVLQSCWTAVETCVGGT